MCIYSAIIKNHKLCDLCEPYTMGLGNCACVYLTIDKTVPLCHELQNVY